MTTKANPRPEYAHQWDSPPFRTNTPHTWMCLRCGCMWRRIWFSDRKLHNTYTTAEFVESNTIPKCEPDMLAKNQTEDFERRAKASMRMGLYPPEIMAEMDERHALRMVRLKILEKKLDEKMLKLKS